MYLIKIKIKFNIEEQFSQGNISIYWSFNNLGPIPKIRNNALVENLQLKKFKERFLIFCVCLSVNQTLDILLLDIAHVARLTKYVN